MKSSMYGVTHQDAPESMMAWDVSSVQRQLFFFQVHRREDIALSVLIRGLHEFVIGGINGLSVFVQLMLVSITAVDSSVFCISFVIRDVFRVPNIWFTRCDAFV
jgi:hypothetical protein